MVAGGAAPEVARGGEVGDRSAPVTGGRTERRS